MAANSTQPDTVASTEGNEDDSVNAGGVLEWTGADCACEAVVTLVSAEPLVFNVSAPILLSTSLKRDLFSESGPGITQTVRREMGGRKKLQLVATES